MISTLLLALALQGSFDARAREYHCSAPETQSQLEMNMCAEVDFERADADLNRIYREEVASAQQADREIDASDHRPTSEVVLRQAQRAWIAFRDAQCIYEGYGEARGGSMEPMVYSGCRARLTRERIAQLGQSNEEAH
jgi:uncharacterized protein YecT (DUF1311 family)